MKIRMTRTVGLTQGSLEALLLERGITTYEKESPESDARVIVTLPSAEVEKLRNSYYQPHGIEVLESDAPPEAPKLYSQEEYERGIADAYSSGHAEGKAEKESKTE